MRVVVADDAVLLREGLARLLGEAEFEVAGLAADAGELLELVQRVRPDVAIVDIRMPPTHTDEGLQAAKAIRERWPDIGILVLSQHVHGATRSSCCRPGPTGVGYLLKERVSDLAELASSVQRVGAGGSVLDPAVVSQLVGRRREADDPVKELTGREWEVLALMAEGTLGKAIAERLCLSEYTAARTWGTFFTTLRLPHRLTTPAGAGRCHLPRPAVARPGTG